MLDRLLINGFRQFDSIEIDFDSDVNIIVGDNDAGKSTVLQAIEMVLTGRIGGRRIEDEISPHWFPRSTTNAYLTALRARHKATLPRILIEVYCSTSPELAVHQGNNNSRREDCPGIRLECEFDPIYEAQYRAFIGNGQDVHSIPVEFYRATRTDFRGNGVVGSRVAVQCAVIDSSALRLQSGTDYYLRKTIDEHLDSEVRARMTLALRAYREKLATDEAFTAANDAIAVERVTLHKKSLRLAPDASAKNAWEAGIAPHLDDIPFGYVGKGEQAAFKTLLALDREPNRTVVLVEEPENHLSHTNLSTLIERVRERTAGKQLILTTHSSFVLNKLGIDHLRLLKNQRVSRFNTLPRDTREYFLKLSGFDTLRLILARAAILVEGASDELIVQKAYLQKFGHLPLVDGVDVISVQALAFRRFLELGRDLGVCIAVVTDLDDDESDAKARKRFEEFELDGVVKGFVGEVADGRTLEPQLIRSVGGPALATILGVRYSTDEALAKHLESDKTGSALKIFEHEEEVSMPDYIDGACEFVQ